MVVGKLPDNGGEHRNKQRNHHAAHDIDEPKQALLRRCYFGFLVLTHVVHSQS